MSMAADIKEIPSVDKRLVCALHQNCVYHKDVPDEGAVWIGQSNADFIEENYPPAKPLPIRRDDKRRFYARLAFNRLAASRWRAMGNDKWADYYEGLSHRKSVKL